jgi:hypothetical protein
MARGFGSTLGSGTTDKVISAVQAWPILSTIAFWAYRNGDGGGSAGRMLDKENDGVLRNSSSGTYIYNRQMSGSTFSEWTFSRPAASEWHHVIWAYDGNSATVDPIAYLDGVAQTLTQTGTGTTPVDESATSWNIGNRSTDDRNWDGALAELAIWNVMLSADEAAALAKGASPLMVRPQALIEYVPMIGPANSWIAGATSITGTAIQPHPRSFYPARRRRIYTVSAAAGGRPALVGGKLTNSLLLGGLAR